MVGRGLSTARLAFVAALAMMLAPRTAAAWVFGEHACITADGVQGLSAADRATLDAAWKRGRQSLDPNQETSLCDEFSGAQLPSVGEAAACGRYTAGANLASGPWCMRFDALPAFAADHSCEPRELLAREAWMRRLLLVSRDSMNELSRSASNEDARVREWRENHIQLLMEDHRYLSRASGNDSHFQPTRFSDDLESHLRRAFDQGQTANAASSFANYHAAALTLAGQAHRKGDAAAAIDALLAEAFALHFLEDGFSAGHTVGTWGRSVDRKGTHDYWCQHGIDARLWWTQSDEVEPSYVAHGDAFLADVDLRHAANAVTRSLAQVAQAFRGELVPDCSRTDSAQDPFCRAVFSSRLNACTDNVVKAGLSPLANVELIQDVLKRQPVPARQEPPMPRFGQEAGVHLGPTVGFDTLSTWRGEDFDFEGLAARARLGVRIGIDLTDILTQYDDTQALGVEAFVTAERLRGETTSGIGGRVRAPFYFLPGDIVITLPLAMCSSRACRYPLRRAAAGSVWWRFERPFVLGENTSFQIVFGRDVGVAVLDRLSFERTARVELFAPLAALRRAYPTGGRTSTGFSFEVGPQLTWIDGQVRAFSVFASLGSATNVYVWAP